MLRLSVLFRKASSSPLFERVFVINLDRRADRWASVQAELKKVHALLPLHTIERISAVDGRVYSDESAVRALESVGLLSHLGACRLLAQPQDRVWGMDLTPGAVGCALSHITLWTRIAAIGSQRRAQQALDAGNQRGVNDAEPAFFIVEDDSCFTEDFLDAYKRLSIPSNWQLLYVGGLDTAGECAHLRLHCTETPQSDGGPCVCHVPRFHRTTHAYVLRPSGARALLRRCLPLTYQIDTMMTMHALPAPRSSASWSATGEGTPFVQDPCCYTIQPPLVRQRSEADSDIQTRH